MSGRLFPLRMTSIEKLHFFDDWPEFPNNIFARLSMSGSLNHQWAEQALQLAAARHVWGAAVVRQRRGTLYWEELSGNQPELVWQANGNWHYQRLDLRTGPVCRLVVQELSAGALITFQVHHAVVDGLGGLQFLRDWLVVYDNLAEGREPTAGLPPVDPYRIRGRNRLGLWKPSFWLRFWRPAIGVFGAAKFIGRRFASLAEASEVRGERDSAFPTTQTVEWDEIELRQLRAFIRNQRLSLNDWLLATLFGALNEWQSSEYGMPLEGWSRVIVPINLRTADDRELPAANRASLVQIDRRPAAESNPLELARGIHFELSLIRDWQLDRMFPAIVRILSLSNRALQRAVARQKKRATAMLTNLGKPLWRLGLPALAGGQIQSGGLVLERIEVVGPIRFGMPISCAVLEYAGKLTMSIHYDARVISSGAAARLAALVKARATSLK